MIEYYHMWFLMNLMDPADIISNNRYHQRETTRHCGPLDRTEVHDTLRKNSCPKLNLNLLKLLDIISDCQEVQGTEEHDKQ